MDGIPFNTEAPTSRHIVRTACYFVYCGGGTGFEHYVKWTLLNDGRVFDATVPESLVYQVHGGVKTLVDYAIGLMYVPSIQFVHYESMSRDPTVDTEETALISHRWGRYFDHDPLAQLFP